MFVRNAPPTELILTFERRPLILVSRGLAKSLRQGAMGMLDR